jgi:hypothetical protein
MKQVHISVSFGGEVILDTKTSLLEGITLLRQAAEDLRGRSLPQFDASWGEQPMPVMVPAEVPTTHLA